MKIRNIFHPQKSENKKQESLPEDNLSVARFVNEGNPDSQIKSVQKKSGENTEKLIPDGDKDC